nr:fibrobacter succinogenes major paralogous domain [uncultured bacterium]
MNINANCRYLNLNGYGATIQSAGSLNVSGVDKIIRDSLISYNIPLLYQTDTLIGHYFLNNLEFYFYGKRRIDGDVDKITRANIKLVNSVDTTLFIEYDDSTRIKLMYGLMNGVRDTTLLKFSYTDTTTIISRFYVNWQNDSLAIREISFNNKRGSLYSPGISIGARKTALQTQGFISSFTIGVAAAVGGIVLLPVAAGCCWRTSFSFSGAASTMVGAMLASGASQAGFLIGAGATIAALVPAYSWSSELNNYDIAPPASDSETINKLIAKNSSLNNNSWLGNIILDSTFTDPRDGQVYTYKTIGSRVWMTQNFNYNLPYSRCYNNDPAYCAIYGRLYSLGDAMRSAPPGWHLPGPDDWQYLFGYLGGKAVAGGHMKATNFWTSPNVGATNSSGFTALPAGEYSGFPGPVFGAIGEVSQWWSYDSWPSSPYANLVTLNNYTANVDVSYSNSSFHYHSVRYAKDWH